MAGLESILKAADLIADVRKAFSKIESLERGQRELLEVCSALDRRVREVEAGLRETRAEVKLDAIKEAQSIVNSVQGQLYGELRSLALTVDRLGREPGASPVIARSPSDGDDSDSINTQR